MLTFTFQDATAAANLQTVWALINIAIDGRQACYVAYYRPGNALFLVPHNGDGSQAQSMVLPSVGNLSNSQCTVSGQGASAVVSGNTLTMRLPIAFKPALGGNKGIWLAAETMNLVTSPWQALGAWTVPGP